MLCVLHGKTIGAKCNLKVAFSLNSWIYSKKVIIQLSVQYRIYLDSCPDNFYHIGRADRRCSHLGTCPIV